MPHWGEVAQRRRAIVSVLAQIWGLVMCLLGSIPLLEAAMIVNQEYLHLIQTGARWHVVSGRLIFDLSMGSVVFAAGVGLIYLGAKERKKAQPVAIEVSDNSI